MLTLPAAISNNKDKINLKPVFLIDIEGDVDFYVSSKEITITGFSYNSLVSQNNSLSMGLRIPEDLNGFSSITFPSVKLTSWRSVLQTGLVGNSPNLSNRTVNIFFMLDAGGTQAKSDSVKIFSGYISHWTAENDLMTLYLKGDVPDLPKVPANLIKDIYPANNSGFAIPIQTGDFDWDIHPLFYAEQNHYAFCPKAARLNEEGSGVYYNRYYIADRQMKTLPTNTNLAKDITGSLATAGIDDAYAFVIRDSIFSPVCFYRNSGNTVNDILNIVNLTSGSYIDIREGTTDVRVWKPATAVGANNNVPLASNVNDGLSTTMATADSSGETVLQVEQFDFRSLVENTALLNSSNKLNIVAAMRLGTVTGSGHYFRFGTWGGVSYQRGFDNTYSDTWLSIDVSTENNDYSDFQQLYDNASAWVSINNPGAASVQILEIAIGVRMQVFDEQTEELYLRCQGRKYEDTWGGRKTSGNLITNPIDVLESVFRHNFSITTDLDTASFDKASTGYGDLGIIARGTLFEQSSGRGFLDDFCNTLNLSVVYSALGKWKIFMAPSDYNYFSVSGTSTPAAMDIFTEAPGMSLTKSYTNHPINKGSFKITTTKGEGIFENVEINYSVWHGGYLQQYVLNAEEFSVKRINAWFVGNDSSAITLAYFIFAIVSKMRTVAEFETYYNGISHEVGDIANIRHGDLFDNLLDNGEVDTAKWIIIEMNHRGRPNLISIKAQELLTL